MQENTSTKQQRQGLITKAGENLMRTSALFDLTGRVAVVTGGNGGIGRSIALGLAEAGAAVAVFGRNDEKNQRVLSELKAVGVPSISMRVDMTNRSGLRPALNKVESELGSLDILVNNAGNVSFSGGVLQEKPEDWDSVIETQLNAVFLLSKLAAKSMLSRKIRKDHKHWQHVFVLWVWAGALLQRREGSDSAAY
jgi:NAD(P)-dependent dehydrogenase (short-subunit alcohol dehydrogenase family)